MIQFKNLTLTRGVKVLLEQASFQLHIGHKVGLIGANGAGKSTLFALLRGELQHEVGDLEIPPQWIIAHVAQEMTALDLPALEFTLDGDGELREVEAALAAAEANHEGANFSGEGIADLHHRLADIEGYSAKARAAALLDGLGFTQADLARPVSDFSGGWRVRLNLARALMCRSDLLLLDEPTNHLDLDAVYWLESWLREYRGTLLLISHDRDFLDAVVNNVLHIELQRITLYRGGYSDFERQRGEKLALQQAMFEKQQRKVAHLHSYIDRFRVQATKARQAQSRIKALERMEMISAAHVDSQFSFEFRTPISAPDPLLVLDDVDAGYLDLKQEVKTILKKAVLAIRPGERLGLLGKNGAGKSTLIKLLAAELAPLNGKRIEGKDLRIGYFAQHQLEQLRPSESPLQHMLRLDPNTREQEHMNYLGGYDFKGDMARSPIENFSGGEKSRLALALLIWTRPNLLLLDEPTNHLDLEMRHALTLALQDYQGGVLLVSHDRALLRASCDNFVLVANGSVSPFDGDLDDYKQWLATQKTANSSSAPILLTGAAEENKNTNSYTQNKAERQARILARRPLIKETEMLEKQIEKLNIEKAKLDARAQEATLYDVENKAELQLLLKRQTELSNLVDAAEMRWLELHEQLETLPEIN